MNNVRETMIQVFFSFFCCCFFEAPRANGYIVIFMRVKFFLFRVYRFDVEHRSRCVKSAVP